MPKYCYIRNCGGLLEFYLSGEERGRIEDLEKKLEILIKGRGMRAYLKQGQIWVLKH